MAVDERSPATETPLPAVSAEESPSSFDPGMALCLSGGGYRATLFHVGALWRLNELRVLPEIKRVSSVSGGAITAAYLGAQWGELAWTSDHSKVKPRSFVEGFVDPLREMTEQTIDVSSVTWGALNPWRTISDEVEEAYKHCLFDGMRLNEIVEEGQPGDDYPSPPRFVMLATNVKTGSLWRFSQTYTADYRVGIIDRRDLDLPVASAVAASTAFPPFLSPYRLDLTGVRIQGDVLNADPRLLKSLRTEAVLSDGGVYDNLGLEAVWKRFSRVLISDAGRRMSDEPSPKDDWARHSYRLIGLLQHQVSSLRRRMAISAFKDDADEHTGTYWGIETDIGEYGLEDAWDARHADTMKIAAIPTRLASLSRVDQERLVNWGYAVCDAAYRRHVAPGTHAKPTSLPYPETLF